MADFKTFTSEEALDDYFSSLLDEDVIEQDVNLEEVREELVEPEPVADIEIEDEPESESVSDWQSDSVTLDTPEPQYQLQASPQVDEYDDYPFEMPQLEDVQRLLSQLENSQLNVQDEIDALVSGEIEKKQNRMLMSSNLLQKKSLKSLIFLHGIYRIKLRLLLLSKRQNLKRLKLLPI